MILARENRLSVGISLRTFTYKERHTRKATLVIRKTKYLTVVCLYFIEKYYKAKAYRKAIFLHMLHTKIAQRRASILP